MFPIKFGVKRSSAMDIELAILYPGSRTLPFPPRVTISHKWTIHETKKISIEFKVRESKAKHTS
jgi:hypothetical protein